MKKLSDHAASGDSVAVWRIDRLGRSPIDALDSVNALRDAGIAVRSIYDGIDCAAAVISDSGPFLK